MKTTANNNSVTDFLNSIEKENKKKDAFELLEIFRRISGEEPKMWGPSIIGFGEYHYKYDSGREGDMFLAGFSPRKSSFSIYIMAGFKEYDKLLKDLGKHKTGKSCLYVNKLADVNKDVLEELIRRSVEYMRARYK